MKRLLVFCLALLLSLPSCLAEEASETRLTTFLDALMRGDEQDALYAQLDEAMQQAIPPADFAALWPQVSALGGGFVAYAGDTQVTVSGGYTVLTQALDMQAMDLLCILSLSDEGKISGLRFTPTVLPQPSTVPEAEDAPYTEEEVTIGEAPWQLPGTLTLPAHASAPVPAVVLVHGSGPSDRDETMGVVKPFRDLAHELARRGIAVLRYDKRTLVYGAAMAGDATLTVEQETIQDAIAAGGLLQSDPRVEAERVYLLGHSLGAMLAPRIAQESEGLFAGLILANGTNLPLEDIILRQNETAVMTLPAGTQRGTALAQIAELRALAERIPQMDETEAQRTEFFGVSAFYFREMAQHPAPAEILRALAKPTLLINGERDFQITVSEGREQWAQALDLSAPWLRCLWADVNHALMRPEVPEGMAGTAAEYYLESTVDAEVIEAIAAFIHQTEEKNE